MEREKLADLVIRFTQAFNRDDLDGVMGVHGRGRGLR